MDNKGIARSFNTLGKLMELHGENIFKIRSYYAAYNTLRRIEKPFHEMSDNELLNLPSIGQTIVDKIRQLDAEGNLKALERYKSITPIGVQQMLEIRGLGPKKVFEIWKNMEIESIGDLILACNENRLVKFKGFGLKTQETIQKNLEYYVASQGKYLFANVIDEANELLFKLREVYPEAEFKLTGDIARKMPEVEGIELISTEEEINLEFIGMIKDEETGEFIYKGYPAFIEFVNPDTFGTEIFMRNASQEFIDTIGVTYNDQYAYEEDLLDAFEMSNIPYEYRETSKAANLALNGIIPNLIETEDIKGLIHSHSTYSDGLHTLREMTNKASQSGYDYFVITDHSKTASYANGLEIERVEMQWREIEELNQKFNDFTIFKGIESDILSDGSLDYPEEILKGFEVVIASVHSNLNMDETTATKRIINAIENKYTKILGHPTGRLLLGRKGYPIDHKKVIDASAANHVCIEINANPQRLDLDWKWIDYAMEKGVLISINPDAHSMDQIDYIKYGVAVARKGGLTKQMCLNCLNISEFENWIALKS
jgi:DNA polymerase (family 10)